MRLRWLVAGFLLGALIIGFLMSRWWQTAPPSPEAQAALAEWLDTSCSVGETPQKDTDLRMFGGQLETTMIDLFQRGPARRDIDKAEAAARQQFERTLALINSGATAGLPDADKQALRAASVDQWAKRAGEDFASSRRVAALAGLGVTGGSKGRQLLQSVAADANSPYRDAARVIIATAANP